MYTFEDIECSLLMEGNMPVREGNKELENPSRRRKRRRRRERKLKSRISVREKFSIYFYGIHREHRKSDSKQEFSIISFLGRERIILDVLIQVSSKTNSYQIQERFY